MQFETREEEVDTRAVKFHALTDQAKMEMYVFHRSVPEENSYHAVAERFGLSKARAKAVLYLMELRDEKQKELLGDDMGLLDGNTAGLKDWVGYVERYKEAVAASPTTEGGEEGETVSNEAIVEEVSRDLDVDTALDAEAKSQEERRSEVEKLLDEMKSADRVSKDFTLADLESKILKVEEHLARLGDVAAYEAKMAKIMGIAADAGYSTNFKEIEGAKGSKSLEDTYFPDLFGDQGRGDVLERLKKRIEADTRASIEVDEDITSLCRTAQDPSPAPEQSPAETLLGIVSGDGSPQTVRDGITNRWKFAFRDLSNPKAPTIIRTRKGTFRKASAWEERMRSWTKKPKHVDVQYHKNIVESFIDPDDDDIEVLKRIKEKLERRKSLIQNNSTHDV